jgi:carbamoyl-phosphate synthase small subunit
MQPKNSILKAEEKILTKQVTHQAILVLADGSFFVGNAIGAEGQTVGEVVFNTAMTGYQEILTDPSYANQIVTLTYPHIGNTGTNTEDNESNKAWASGLVIRDLPLMTSNFRSEVTLQDWLCERKVVAIADIDTRRLTRLLRDRGAQSGCLLAGPEVAADLETAKVKALAAAKAFPGLKGMDLAKEVTCAEQHEWVEGSWQLGVGHPQVKGGKYHVVAYDFGAKNNIFRMLKDRDCRLTVVPAKTPADSVLAMKPDGIFLSNGPGDPEPCTYAIDAVKTFLEKRLPIFGICLGHQLLALACGAKTIKMTLGHHGANHPVQQLSSGKVAITSQNHGFAVDEASLPSNLQATYRSLFDSTLQGIAHLEAPAIGFQGHPEASPGPHDIAPVFDHFVKLMKQHQSKAH